MRVALVTGSATGIGRSAALALARAGYDVAINYSRSEAAARETVKDAEAAGARLSRLPGGGRRLFVGLMGLVAAVTVVHDSGSQGTLAQVYYPLAYFTRGVLAQYIHDDRTATFWSIERRRTADREARDAMARARRP